MRGVNRKQRFFSTVLAVVVTTSVLIGGAVSAPTAAEASTRGSTETVRRLYQASFSRQPDDSGLVFWVGELERGRPLIELAESFASSPEFIRTYGELDDEAFIRLVYRNVLDRQPDAGGLAHWLEQLRSGATSRPGMMIGFSESEEFVINFSVDAEQLRRLYVAYFLREPDAAGQEFWIRQRAQGVELAAVSAAFASSQEFIDRYGALNDAEFLDKIYENVVRRPADAGGYAFWLERLQSGALDRGALMIQFSESPEFKELSAPGSGPNPPPAEVCDFSDSVEIAITPGASRTGIRVNYPAPCGGTFDFVNGTHTIQTVLQGDGVALPLDLESEPVLVLESSLVTFLSADLGAVANDFELDVTGLIVIREGRRVVAQARIDRTELIPSSIAFRISSAPSPVAGEPFTVSLDLLPFEGPTSRPFSATFTTSGCELAAGQSSAAPFPSIGTGRSVDVALIATAGVCELSIRTEGPGVFSLATFPFQINPAAPSGLRVESSSCNGDNCTMTVSALQSAGQTLPIVLAGASTETFGNGMTSFFGPGSDPVAPGERGVMTTGFPVTSFCFWTFVPGAAGAASEPSNAQCVDRVGNTYVQRHPTQVELDRWPFLRNDGNIAAGPHPNAVQPPGTGDGYSVRDTQAPVADQVTYLYLAAFERQPDQAGLAFYISNTMNNSLLDSAQRLTGAGTLFADESTEESVIRLLDPFDASEDDIDAWIDRIDSNAWTLPEFVAYIAQDPSTSILE